MLALVWLPLASASSYNLTAEYFTMTNVLHGYGDDARCDRMADEIRAVEAGVRELDARKHLKGVWVSSE